ncbi:hypothetical protein [Marinobacterium lutimaris]|nr:hypothetical protein [Marinobacterium lutimaris]
MSGTTIWALISANQEIGRLQADNETLRSGYEYAANERTQLDQLYAAQKRETYRVQSNLEQQIDALRNAKADACAHAVVTADRISILQQPVWLDTSGSMPSDTAELNSGDPLPGASVSGDEKPGG